MATLRPISEPKPPAAASTRSPISTLLRAMAGLALGYILLLAYLHHQGDPQIQRRFGGAPGIAALNHADRIEVYRVAARARRNSSNNALDDFPITKGPMPIPQYDADTLLATLQDRNSYLVGAPKGCEFAPGVRFDFSRDNDRLSVLVCFECDAIVNYLNGKIVGGGNTEKVRPTLVKIAHSLFPDDRKIQSVSEQRSTPPAGK